MVHIRWFVCCCVLAFSLFLCGVTHLSPPGFTQDMKESSVLDLFAAVLGFKANYIDTHTHTQAHFPCKGTLTSVCTLIEFL